MQEQEAPKEFVVSVELLQGILNYLSTQPFQEVNGLINDIQSKVKPVEAPVEPVDLKKVK